MVFFDGVCNLCSASVQFIINRDPGKRFRFASLQSEYAKKHLPEELTREDNLQSFVLLTDNGLYKKSTAALKIARQLKGLWPLFYGFIIIPKFLRDAVYSLVASNRYKIFGKKNACMVPSPELKSLFLD